MFNILEKIYVYRFLFYTMMFFYEAKLEPAAGELNVVSTFQRS